MTTNQLSGLGEVLLLQAKDLRLGGCASAAGAVSSLGRALSDIAECGCPMCRGTLAKCRRVAEAELYKVGGRLNLDVASLELQQ